MKVPKKMKQVKIDPRFKKALKSKEFNLVQKVDKYGKRVDKQDTTMQAFYKLDESEGEKQSEEEAPKGGANQKYYDEEGKFKWEAQSSSEDE